MMRRIEPSRLHDVWNFVRIGLEVLQDKNPDGWLPEDIYTAIRNGTALLYADPGKTFIVGNVVNRYDGQQELHIWCAYGPGHMDSYSHNVDEIARQLGCVALTFFSPRKGWVKNRIGFEEVHTLYRKTL